MVHLVAIAMFWWYVSSSYSQQLFHPKVWHIHVKDWENNFQKYFKTESPIETATQWTLRVNTEKFGQDFIVFFATDHDRPLEYSCAFSRALCDFSVLRGIHNDHAHETVVSAYLKHPVFIPAPAMAGDLMICTARVDFFWKRPLINDFNIHSDFNLPIDSTGRRYYCNRVNPATPPREDIIVPPDQTACVLKTFSCTGGAKVLPDVQAADMPDLELHTWYMTKENYREMREGRLINLVVPLFGSAYKLFLYGTLELHTNESCEVIKPTGHRAAVDIHDKVLNRLKYPIYATELNSGVYSVSCTVMYHNAVEGHSHVMTIKKTLNVTFIRGPKIILGGLKGYVSYFAPNLTSSDILVIVYTTTPLVSFEVTRIGKSISDRVFTSFLSHSPYEIVWKHNIRVSKLDYDTNGPYVIKIRNEDGDTAEQTFTIKKAKELIVMVAPVHSTVQAGSPVRLECAVIGNLIEKIQWARDIEDKITDKSIAVTKVRHGKQESRGLRLTIKAAKMRHSGIYECRVSNRYQEITKSVELVVWPRGGPYRTHNTSESHLPEDGLPPGPTVLDIFEDEIIREYAAQIPDSSTSTATEQFTGGMLSLLAILGLELAAIFVLVATHLCVQRRKHRKALIRRVATTSYSSSESENEDRALVLKRRAKRRRKKSKDHGKHRSKKLAIKRAVTWEDGTSKNGVESEVQDIPESEHHHKGKEEGDASDLEKSHKRSKKEK